VAKDENSMTQPEHGEGWRERLERWSVDERVASAWRNAGKPRTITQQAGRQKKNVRKQSDG